MKLSLLISTLRIIHKHKGDIEVFIKKDQSSYTNSIEALISIDDIEKETLLLIEKEKE